MKNKFVFCVFIALLLLPGIAVAVVAKNVTPDQAYQLVEKREELFLLDVRTFGEYRQARLAGARLIPIDQLGKRLSELPIDRPILVYCAVGSRSAQVVNFLARRGYPEVYNLYGGIYSWAQRGLPVLEGGP